MEITKSTTILRFSQTSRRQSSRNNKLTAPLLFLLLFLIVWEIVVRIFHIPLYLLPSPIMVFNYIIDNLFFLMNHAVITFFEAIIGFIVANLLAFIIAVVFVHSAFCERGLFPYAIALKTTPIIAMAPILILWLGSGILSKIAASSLICFFPMLVNTNKGLRSVDIEALDLFESFGATKMQIFSKLRLPYSLPLVFSALKISTSLSVVGAIVGEFVGADKGLGYIILTSSYHFEMPKMFSAIIASAIIGILFFLIILKIENRLLHWHSSSIE